MGLHSLFSEVLTTGDIYKWPMIYTPGKSQRLIKVPKTFVLDAYADPNEIRDAYVNQVNAEFSPVETSRLNYRLIIDVYIFSNALSSQFKNFNVVNMEGYYDLGSSGTPIVASRPSASAVKSNWLIEPAPTTKAAGYNALAAPYWPTPELDAMGGWPDIRPSADLLGTVIDADQSKGVAIGTAAIPLQGIYTPLMATNSAGALSQVSNTDMPVEDESNFNGLSVRVYNQTVRIQFTDKHVPGLDTSLTYFVPRRGFPYITVGNIALSVMWIGVH